MSELKKFQLIYFFVAFSIFSSIAFAQNLPGDWRGYVTINSTTAQDGFTVSAILNNNTTYIINTTVGSVQTGIGYYLIHVPGDAGNTVTFKVCGVNASIPSQSWSAGPHLNATSSSPYFNFSVNTTADGTSCVFACGCSGGYCNSGVCASSAPTTTTTVATGGGSGGGGLPTTTTTTTTTTPAIQEVQVVQNISAGQTATIEINKSNDLKLQEISIEVKNTVSNVQITIKETTQPAGASLVIGSADGSVYKYLEISKTNIQDSDISKVKIKFKVEKSWLTANGIDKNIVSLSRLVGTSWAKLPTTILSEDSTYVYYEAESPGLSVFAVSGRKLTSTQTTTTTTPPVTVPVVAIPSDMTFIYVVVLIVLVLAVVYAVWHFKKKKFFSKVTSS